VAGVKAGPSARALLAPHPAAVERGQRFAKRREAWRSDTQRHYGRHAQIEPHAPKILAHMFDRVVAIVGPSRAYAFKSHDTETVFMNGENWRWHTMLGTAEGRGLYELWAWRYDIPIPLAGCEIFALVNDRGEDDA
jgi:hypothetical protein